MFPYIKMIELESTVYLESGFFHLCMDKTILDDISRN